MKYIYTLFLLISLNIFSQSAKIVYKASLAVPNTANFAKKNSLLMKKLNIVKNNIKDINCVLDVHNGSSLFYLDEEMDFDSKVNLMNMTIFKVGKGVFFTKLTKKIINSKNSFGEDFRVQYPEPKWKLTKETKNIGKYVCSKALATVEVHSRRGVEKVLVEAWFTEQLPYGFGPKQFSGLPGLILELKEGSLTFKASKIELNNPLIKVEEPKKGKLIQLKKYREIVKKITEQR